MEDLLLEAAERYPNGTKFLSLFDYRVYTSNGVFHVVEDRICMTICGVGCVYNNTNWAAVVATK